MESCTRRMFSKQILLFSVATALGIPASARAVGINKFTNDPFLNRDDLSDALKSLYMTYDSTSPYPHKFNEVLTKTQLRSLQFFINKNLEKEYVSHYIKTMKPLITKIQKRLQEKGAEEWLRSMFEGTSSGYQLFERIDIQKGKRIFPCPYKEMLENCKKHLMTFSIEWQDVCSRWCIPIWTGVAEAVGIRVSVQPGETCSIALLPN